MDVSTLSLAKDYTDEQVNEVATDLSTEVQARIDADAQTLTSAKEYTNEETTRATTAEALKQNKTDSDLQTTSKTVVGAINEVNSKVSPKLYRHNVVIIFKGTSAIHIHIENLSPTQYTAQRLYNLMSNIHNEYFGSCDLKAESAGVTYKGIGCIHLKEGDTQYFEIKDIGNNTVFPTFTTAEINNVNDLVYDISEG